MRFIELLFTQNYNRIYEYCYWKLGSHQDAEDSAMETFLRAAGRTENRLIQVLSKPGLWMQRLTAWSTASVRTIPLSRFFRTAAIK